MGEDKFRKNPFPKKCSKSYSGLVRIKPMDRCLNLENLHADRTTVCFEPWQKLRARFGARKTGLSPPVFLYWSFQGGTSVVVPYCSCCLCLYFGSSIMLVTYFVNFGWLSDHLFGKELFILFAPSAFRKLSSIYVFNYFPFGFEGGVWDLIVSVPGRCLPFYLEGYKLISQFVSTIFPAVKP